MFCALAMQKNFVLLWPSDMRVIVVGCGTNGRELTRRLSARGHQVTLVAAAHEPEIGRAHV